MEQSQAFDYASMDKFHLEPPTVPLSGDSRYLTPLWLSPLLRTGLEQEDANIGAIYQKLQYKIHAALKSLAFREEHVYMQFWSPTMVQKRWFLTTKAQPFGVGVVDDGLLMYRRDSELKSFIVNKDHEQEDSPVVRVFKRGLPEWTLDVTNYLPKHFPQIEYAKRCNFRGYLALPVFSSTECVGVLELLTTSNTYPSYAYEVKNICEALKTQNLTSSRVCVSPALYVLNEHRQKDHSKILGILKMMCDIHSVPLAQTWGLSPHTCFVAHEKAIEKSCSSFDIRCVGKACMSTADLPLHLKDVNMCDFRKACKTQHLDRSRDFVGKALLARGSCFCGDVTKLGEEEYSLVYYARMYRLTSCFAIFLHSVEANDDYVLEFFLPPDIKESRHVHNLVETLKQLFEIASGFELGDTSMIQVFGPPIDQSGSMLTDVTQASLYSVAGNYMSSDSESLLSTGSTYDVSKSKRGRKRKIGSAAAGASGST